MCASYGFELWRLECFREELVEKLGLKLAIRTI
jgi:hypothetical protein